MHHPTKSPCKGCTERTVDPPCHDLCPKYLAFSEDIEAIRSARHKDNTDHNRYMTAVIKRADRRRGK